MLCLSKNEYKKDQNLIYTKVFFLILLFLLHSSKAMKPLPKFRCLAFTGGAFGVANAVCVSIEKIIIIKKRYCGTSLSDKEQIVLFRKSLTIYLTSSMFSLVKNRNFF